MWQTSHNFGPNGMQRQLKYDATVTEVRYDTAMVSELHQDWSY